MPEKLTPQEAVKIRYEGIYDWNDLYAYINKWFREKKFDYYEVKNVKKPGTYGYEREYEAHAEREESGYVRHDIDIKMHMYHCEDVEVIVNGHKKQKNRAGLMMIEIMPSVTFDWQKKWEKGFKKKARKFFHDYLVRGYAMEQLDKIYYEMYKLHTGIKEHLDLESKYSAY